MTMLLTKHLFTIMLLLSSAIPVQSHKHKLYIAQHGHDSVGANVAYSLREEASKSARYAVVSESQADVRIELVSADEGEARFSERGRSSALSFVFTVRSATCAEKDWLFLKQGVYIVGNERTTSVAKGILSTLDEALSN
jgi:hypothetical protein